MLNKLKVICPDWQYRNSATGEIKDIEIALPKSYLGGIWLKLFQAPMASILGNKTLKGEALRLFFFFVSTAKYDNELPTPSTAARTLQIHIPSAYRAYKQLLNAKIIIKKEVTYYLNPWIAWKGTAKKQEEAIRKLGVEYYTPLDTLVNVAAISLEEFKTYMAKLDFQHSDWVAINQWAVVQMDAAISGARPILAEPVVDAYYHEVIKKGK